MTTLLFLSLLIMMTPMMILMMTQCVPIADSEETNPLSIRVCYKQYNHKE